MIARGIIRWRRRFAALISPDITTTAVAGKSCPHATAADIELTVRRLLASVIVPEHFAAQLSKFVNCAGCAAAVIAQLSFERGGLMLSDDADADATATPPTCTCSRPVNAPVMALRLSLGYDSHDSDAM